jgi:hypothetical protein
VIKAAVVLLGSWMLLAIVGAGGGRYERPRIKQVEFAAAPPLQPAPARNGTFVLACDEKNRPISALIYGVGGAGGTVWNTGTTARRWGGNPTSRYNWELNAWNLTKDWFFRNRALDSSFDQFLKENQQHEVSTAVTVPMLGWVAKDSTSYSFPVSVFGPQQATGWDEPNGGNGIGRDGKPLRPGPPTRTSIPSTPDTIERWVQHIREKDRSPRRSVQAYILDNEPMLWNSTHRDVHPAATTYDELLQTTIAYASAVRRADPDAWIAGPAEWGWLAYQYSAQDVEAGVQSRPDRRRHGDVPLIPWYLRSVREYEQRTGARILDVLDVHFYPMASGVGIGTNGDTDPGTAARRIRSTRSLWDPTYLDESWINERMRVLPLLREWVATNHPGLGISIGEWNFGAETHVSGGLAVAEALGRFGTEGVTSAYYWTSPAERSPAFWAFRAYRNFDGAGGHFLDWSVPVKADAALASLFASRSQNRGRVVAVLLNLDPASPLATHIDVQACGEMTTARAFTYSGGVAGFRAVQVSPRGRTLEVTAGPYTITVLDLTMSAASR